ncbi:HNH endonuclease-domain-containing protein [Trichophaea hybrida]|nr:HNH endonuclease-domain-containing protein [Trichophaea hybrida]
MSVANRSAGRDVHIYSANDSATVLGGLILTNGVTNANFHSMVDIIFIFCQDYFLRDEGGTTVQKDDHPLQPGNYYIVTNGSITVNNEPWLVRTISVASGTRVAVFRDAVRERDRRCVVTGKPALRADHGIWRGFEAAHIFPLAYEGHWNKENYGRWITIPAATESTGTINSVQNGMLLRADIHSLFDSYDISINPDDNYKIVCFGPDGNGIAGNHLDQQLLQDPHRPVHQLLRWHFRQAVLANMRGAGEPVFEVDFPPGSDMMGEIMSGPMAAERMEFELFSRLAVQ